MRGPNLTQVGQGGGVRPHSSQCMTCAVVNSAEVQSSQDGLYRSLPRVRHSGVSRVRGVRCRASGFRCAGMAGRGAVVTVGLIPSRSMGKVRMEWRGRGVCLCALPLARVDTGETAAVCSLYGVSVPASSRSLRSERDIRRAMAPLPCPRCPLDSLHQRAGCATLDAREDEMRLRPQQQRIRAGALTPGTTEVRVHGPERDRTETRTQGRLLRIH